MIKGLKYIHGMGHQPGRKYPKDIIAAVSVGASEITPAISKSFEAERIGELAGEYGDRAAGNPVELDELMVEAMISFMFVVLLVEHLARRLFFWYLPVERSDTPPELLFQPGTGGRHGDRADSVAAAPRPGDLCGMKEISFDDFLKVELRVGKIVSAEPLPEARKPAFILQVDFGDELGILKSSAQITDLYGAEELIGKLVVGVVNFPPKQIGPIHSRCLITGFHDDEGRVALCVPDKPVPLGAKLL